MRKCGVFLLFFIMLAGAAVPAQGQDNEGQTYTVQPGDTLWKISQQYQIELHELLQANPQFENPNRIQPGDRVNIPASPKMTAKERLVIKLVNDERTQRGLAPLKANPDVSGVAREKSRDMRDRNYFSHTSPTYGSPFEMLRQFGISFRSAGENIAAGQRTAKDVVQGWMNSPGHRKNILNSNYTQIGVGYAEGGRMRHYWTQMFIRP